MPASSNSPSQACQSNTPAALAIGPSPRTTRLGPGTGAVRSGAPPSPCSRGEVEPHDFCSGGETIYEMRLHSAMMLSGGGYDRRCIMAMAVQQIHSIAHLPLVLGVLRRLEVATVIDRLIPPHPAHVLSCGRVVCPRVADNIPAPPPCRLHGVNQPVMSPRNGFAGPLSTRLTCSHAHLSGLGSRSSS